jgi:hypothetical protein
MKKISRYSFSFILIFFCSSVGFSQTDSTKTTIGLRLGFDVSKLSLYLLQPERKAMEFSADMELFKNVFPSVEFGSNNIKLLKDTLYNYYSNGSYVRIGADYNLLKPADPKDKDMFTGGIRYGYAFYTDYADSIVIKDNYWGNYHGSLPKKSMNAQWFEIAFGMKTELFKNFFIGWSLRSRILLAKSKNDIIVPYWIPGYGKGIAKANFGFNYSIFYSIPLYKKQFKVADVKGKKN